jgi:DNA polymerase III gamma/tau subunit
VQSFVVSARKYRPSSWHDVIGQDQVVVTLKNAIKNNHLAQSFLFCGPRGVGKNNLCPYFGKKQLTAKIFRKTAKHVILVRAVLLSMKMRRLISTK